MAELVFQNNNGNDVTTSLLVAEVFGKEHSKVVRDIESLSCSASFNAANFGVITRNFRKKPICFNNGINPFI